MKKRIILITILLIIITLTACVKDTPPVLESPITPKDWTEYIDEYAKIGANSLKADNGKDIFHYKIQLEFEYNISGKESLNDKFLLDINVNISLKSDDKNLNNGYIRIYKLGNNGYFPIFELYNDNDIIYLHSGDIKHKLKRAPLFEIIKNIIQDIESDKIENFLRTLGKNLFIDAYANKEKDNYTLVFDIKSFFNNPTIGNFIESFPYEWQTALYKLASANSYKEFVGRLPNIRCNLVTKIKNNMFSEFNIENGSYVGNESDGIINLKTKEFSLNSITDDTVLTEFPRDEEEYVSVDFGNIDTVGTVSLESQKGSYIDYEYEFISSINLFQLLAFNGDISKLQDDNFFHLRIKHKCNEKCSTYCAGKIQKSEGALLDIAYSKSQFGTPFIYVSVNIKALLSRDVISTAIPGLGGTLISLLSDYKLFTIDTAVYNKIDSTMLLKLILGFINISSFPNDTKIDIDFNKLLDKINLPDNASLLITQLLSNGKDELDNISITTTKKIINKVPNGNAIYNKTLFIIDNYSEKTKTYDSSILDKASPAINWDFYEKFDINDIKSYNLYMDDRLCYGFEDGKFIPMTKTEAQNINKMKIKYSYTNVFGEEIFTDLSSNKKDATARILRAEGVDYELFNKKQRVKLYVSYPSYFVGYAFFNSINNVFPMDEILYTVIETDIYLVKTKKVEILREHKADDGTEKNTYFYGEKYDASILNATASLYYNNDEYKKFSILGKIDGLETDGFLLNEGDFVITYNILGEEFTKVITVKRKDENYSYYFNNNDQNVNLSFYTDKRIANFEYGKYFYFRIKHTEDKETYINKLLFQYLYINGIEVTKGGQSGWSFSDEYITFNKKGTFNIRYFIDGMIDKTIIFTVKEESIKPSNSIYKINDTTSYRNDYFTSGINDDYSYVFKGNLVNSFHGDIGIEGQLKLAVVIEKGYTNSSGSLSFKTALTEDFSIVKLKFDGAEYQTPYDNCFIPSLPPTLYKPKEISVNLKFFNEGVYRVKFSIGEGKIYFTSQAFKVQQKLI